MSAVGGGALGRRDGGSILILAVDDDFEIFEAVALLSDSESQGIFARLRDFNSKHRRASVGGETGDISSGIEALVLHYFRVAEECRIVCGDGSFKRTVGVGDADIFNIGRKIAK